MTSTLSKLNELNKKYFNLFCKLFSANHIKENLYIAYAGLQLPKFSKWLQDFNKAIGLMRAGVNFINVFLEAFTRTDSKSPKDTDDLTVNFVLLGPAFVKAAHKTMMKSSPDAYLSTHFTAIDHLIMFLKEQLVKFVEDKPIHKLDHCSRCYKTSFPCFPNFAI